MPGLGQENGELVPAKPCNDVRLARAGLDDVGRLDEGAAAEQVAVGIVDSLETVEIDEEQRQRPAAAHRALRFLAKGVVEVPRVEELGEVVGDRQRLGASHAEGVRQRIGRGLEQADDRVVQARRHDRQPTRPATVDADEDTDDGTVDDERPAER